MLAKRVDRWKADVILFKNFRTHLLQALVAYWILEEKRKRGLEAGLENYWRGDGVVKQWGEEGEGF